MDNKYIQKLSKQIKNKNAKNAIEEELYSHILDKADYYYELGYSHEEAMEKATEDMGNADDSAVPLNTLYNNHFNIVFNILSFILLISIIIFYNKNNYHFSYIGDNLYLVPHYISFDFISTLIFACYSLLLWLSHKQKNKEVPIMIILSFTVMTFFSFQYTHHGIFHNSPTNIFHLFQPMSYSIVNIFTKGISDYINSIFGYSYVTLNNLNFILYNTFSITCLLVIILLTVIILVNIYKMERMLKSITTLRISQHTLKILSLFVAVNIGIMSICTVVAYNSIENKIEESKINRAQMIRYVVNADTTIDLENQLNEIENAGFCASQKTATETKLIHISYAYQQDNNLIKISPLESDSYDKYKIIFDATNEENSLLDKKMFCNETDKKIIKSFKSGDTLQNFLQNNVYTKACETTKYNISNNKEEISFCFAFYEPHYDEHLEEWYEITYYYIYFENGILVKY
ncbi:MAG: permease prefix domain 1-containing protein [Ruminococcus sp.]|nr:permease prefix domain 1-containing protein [Ruminococcus sp.]